MKARHSMASQLSSGILMHTGPDRVPMADEDVGRDESEVREQRANEEFLVRAKLRAFKAARPRVSSADP